MPGIAEVQALIEQQGRDFEAFKAAHQKQLDEMKARGAASAETKAEVDRINAALQEVTTQLRELETKSNRPGGAGADASEVDAKAKRAAFLNLMRGREVAPDIRAALVEDATGEILVPEDVLAGITRTAGKFNVMRTLASVQSTTSNRVRRRGITEVTMGWGKLETGGALTESTPTPDEAYIYVEDLNGLVRVGRDELADSDVNLSAMLEDSFGRAAGEMEETAFVVGTGHANAQPTGFTDGATVTRVTADGPGAITALDLLALQYAVGPAYRRNGSYIVNSSTELAMRSFVDTNGQFLWQPSLQEGRPTTFAGRPIYNQEDLVNVPAAGVAADPAAFGDWKAGYRIVDRLRMTVQRLNELYASAGMVGFLAYHRVGGGVIEADALRILRVPAA